MIRRSPMRKRPASSRASRMAPLPFWRATLTPISKLAQRAVGHAGRASARARRPARGRDPGRPSGPDRPPRAPERRLGLGDVEDGRALEVGGGHQSLECGPSLTRGVRSEDRPAAAACRLRAAAAAPSSIPPWRRTSRRRYPRPARSARARSALRGSPHRRSGRRRCRQTETPTRAGASGPPVTEASPDSACTSRS